MDSTGPWIVSYTPHEVRNATFDHIDLTFSEPVDSSTFAIDEVAIAGPDGAIILTGVTQLAGDTFQVTFPALTVRGN